MLLLLMLQNYLRAKFCLRKRKAALAVRWRRFIKQQTKFSAVKNVLQNLMVLVVQKWNKTWGEERDEVGAGSGLSSSANHETNFCKVH